MKIFSAYLSCFLLLIATAAVAAQDYVAIENQLTPEQLRSVGLTTNQLRMLNQMLRQAQAKTIAVASPTTISKADAEPDPGKFIGFNDAPIRAHAKGTIRGWQPDSVFELDNGQRWKVLKGQLKLPKPIDDPEIILVPGIAGRWFLQIDEDLPKARVYRID